MRLIIGMFDKDNSGTIYLAEFGALWKYKNDWQNTFRSYDRDNSGHIDKSELQNAGTSFGYKLSGPLYTSLIRKFDRSGRKVIKFDDFVQCIVSLQMVTLGFQEQDADRDGVVSVNFEQLLNMALDNKLTK